MNIFRRQIWGWYDRMSEPWRFLTMIGMIITVITLDIRVIKHGPFAYWIFCVFVLLTRSI